MIFHYHLLNLQMSALVIDFVPVGCERPPTVSANVRFLPRVGADVMSEARYLRKLALAVGKSAGIWLDPKVYILMA